MNTSENIMNVASKLILEKGYSAFSYADIAGVIGIQKASIHYHFPSKANLVQSVVSHYRREIKAQFALLDSMTDDPRGKLEQYLSYWNNCLEQEPTEICLCALLASEIPILPEEVRGEIQEHFQDLAGWLKDLLPEAGDAGKNEPGEHAAEETAQMMMASIHGGMLTARTFNDSKYFKMVKNQLLQKASLQA